MLEELTERVKRIGNLTDLEDLDTIDPNYLFMALIKANRLGFIGDNIKIHFDKSKSSSELIEYIISDSDISFDLYNSGFLFNKKDLFKIYLYMHKYHFSDYKYGYFFDYFLRDKDQLNEFLHDHRKMFARILRDEHFYIPYPLSHNNEFNRIILENGYSAHISNIQVYDVTNLKLLAGLVKKGLEVDYYLGNGEFAELIFKEKDSLKDEEFYYLLTLFKESVCYNSSHGVEFEDLVKDNIDYLIRVTERVGKVPKCLAELSIFRDECIKKGKINLAVQCTLPDDIFKDSLLVQKFCAELNITRKEFYTRGMWILDYYKRNHNIFNTLISTCLKSNIFNLGEEHFERFINDMFVQISLNELNNKELELLKIIISGYNYQEADVTLMINNVIKNMKDYRELVSSLDLQILTSEDIKMLIKIMQFPKNPYEIKNIIDVKNYYLRKVERYSECRHHDLHLSKDSLLKLLFNIDLKEASFINFHFCYDRNGKVLEELSRSELPKEAYNYLVIINKIVESKKQEEIDEIYETYKDQKIYDSELPLDCYLRSVYAKLYDDTLYHVDSKEAVELDYQGKKVKTVIPRDNFHFMVHCIGSCSLSTDVIDPNYQRDWENRPQIQDHFVACSFIDEKGIFSIRSEDAIIMGFDHLEPGSLYGMGDTDIDSFGYYAKLYSPSAKLVHGNRDRAHYYIPSRIVERLKEGYNEFVIERRDGNPSSNHFKKCPDYIIMMTDTLDENTFKTVNQVFDEFLTFVTEEDKELLKKTKFRDDLVKIFKKYQTYFAEQNLDFKKSVRQLINIIIQARNYEDCLRAASEFDVPLVVIDRTYYLTRVIDQNGYDQESKNIILQTFNDAPFHKKGYVYQAVLGKKSVEEIRNIVYSRRSLISL